MGWEHLHGPLHITDPAPPAPRPIQGSPQHDTGQTRNSPVASLSSLFPSVVHSFLTSLPLSPLTLTLPPLPLSSTVAHEHLKDRGLFGLPPPPGASPAEYYHLMASHRSPYGELLMQGAGATAGAHLSDYITPIDGE